MDLKLFFDKVPEEAIEKSLSYSSFQKSIFINHSLIYELDGIEIALIGIQEYSGAGIQNETDQLVEIRKSLYKLSKTSGNNRILDLGNLRNGPTAEETSLRLKEVVSFLLSKNILPIIFGGSHDMDLGQYKAYEGTDKLITWLSVDSSLDLKESNNADESHLGDIMKYDPNFLFHFINLGYQSYFVMEEEKKLVENLFFEMHRLGEIKSGLEEFEPIIRDADALSFDLSSIQSHYCNAVKNPNAFGLTGEEACQISWYAGLNDKLSSIGFYNYLPLEDDSNYTTAHVLATMMWYFIEGYYHRKGDINFLSNDYLVFEVPFNSAPESIRFYKSNLSEKWWLEIPDSKGTKSVFIRNKMIPCSYADYEKATNGEVPERYLSAFSKINT